jgi:hypothetical protein
MIDEEDDDDSPFDERGILKDGRSIRVSFMDSLKARQGPGGARTQPLVGDARFVPMADAKQALADAYRDYDLADDERWRHPPNGPPLQRDASGEVGRDIPAGAYPLSAGEGSRCTINGADGSLVRKGNWLVCEPVRKDAMPVHDARAEAYRLYDEEMANAWRNPR